MRPRSAGVRAPPRAARARAARRARRASTSSASPAANSVNGSPVPGSKLSMRAPDAGGRPLPVDEMAVGQTGQRAGGLRLVDQRAQRGAHRHRSTRSPGSWTCASHSGSISTPQPGALGHASPARRARRRAIRRTGLPARGSSRRLRSRTRGTCRRWGWRASRCIVNSVTIDRLALCGVHRQAGRRRHARHPQRARRCRRGSRRRAARCRPRASRSCGARRQVVVLLAAGDVERRARRAPAAVCSSSQ